MKIKLLSLFLAASLPLFAGDTIEHCATYADALNRVARVAQVTAGGQMLHPHGWSMLPHEWVGVTVKDFGHTLDGDRVNFIGADGKIICHRVEAHEKDGSLRVSGDTWPWRTDCVTPKNYLGTVVLMVTWDKR